MKIYVQTIKAFMLMLFCCNAIALPDLSKTIEVNNVKLLRDRDSENTYYLVPKGVRILERADGGPDLNLSLLQYIGSNAREDNGRFELYSTFRIRVGLERATQDERRVIETQLSQRFKKTIKVLDLTIDQVNAHLVSSVGGETPIAQSWQFDEASGTTSGAPISATWHQRDLVMSFAAHEAELLERILKQQDAGLSLSYSMASKAWRIGESELEGNLPQLSEITGSSESEIEDELIGEDDGSNSDAQIEIVAADAIPIQIADEFIESRIKRTYLDGSLPASYPSLAVYYFDMRNGNADGIFLRHVEVEAAGVSGGNTRYSAFFESTRPQDYAVTVRFPYAVNLREPYRWRAIDVLQNGEMQVGPWTQSDNWSTVINVSGPLNPDPAQTNLGDKQ